MMYVRDSIKRLFYMTFIKIYVLAISSLYYLFQSRIGLAGMASGSISGSLKMFVSWIDCLGIQWIFVIIITIFLNSIHISAPQTLGSCSCHTFFLQLI